MKSPIKDYLFWIKVFASAILLAVGIWLLVDKQLGNKFVTIVTGAALLIFAAIRVYPLVKADTGQKYKTVVTVEIVVNVLVAALLLYIGLTLKEDDPKGLHKFVIDNYRFFVGVVLYARGVIYFIGTSFLKMENTILKFVLHISFITIGSIFFARSITVRHLAIFIALLALLSCAYLALDSGITFNNYSNRKKKEKQDDVEKADEVSDSQVEKDVTVNIIQDEIGEQPNVN